MAYGLMDVRVRAQIIKAWPKLSVYQKHEVVAYFRTKDTMAAWENLMQEDKIKRNRIRGKMRGRRGL